MFASCRLHSELGGKIKQNREQPSSDMKCVEAVIKMPEPG